MLKRTNEIVDLISGGYVNTSLKKLYGDDEKTISSQKKRYIDAVSTFDRLYPEQKGATVFSTPGRTEICGNHTDHNLGLVIAAAVDLDVIGAACISGDDKIVIKSEGHEIDVINTTSLTVQKEERFTSAALIRGICEGFRRLGYTVRGFRAYTTSDVLKGSGLSSSAAFEVLVASMINHFFCGNTVSDIQLAKIARFAENEYFGKPCGLMDQLACSVGGFVMIDFLDHNNPEVTKIRYDFSKMNADLIIIDTGGSHSDMNDDYAALPKEMKAVAGYFDKSVLREINRDDLMANIKSIRGVTGDRAILRAIHYFDENIRVQSMFKALEAGDTDTFFRIVRSSGDSSWKLCQNCYSCNDTANQGITLALALSERILNGNGAFRVHGGGFAGTIQVFVPKHDADGYINKMHAAFGDGACKRLAIRSIGNTLIDFDKS